jgi:hypothetical protein
MIVPKCHSFCTLSFMLEDVVLLFVLLFTIVLVVTTIYHLFLKVPFIPTSKYIADHMIDCAGLTGTETVFDLGAGDGRLLAYVKERHPKVKAIGCELVPTIWLWGKLYLKIKKASCTSYHLS